ncbi:hypothetical protein C8F04DRAFT_1237901 [Mycena alexandri]|uniref:Apple domain-containing protein n=1 Tax=Mycena alexandri TaxID=1745969 RepID=A0AAD6SH67_9AGAR|nr:hypothetical protein C8F04DRAFT_1237901 [Mycena alexandri]
MHMTRRILTVVCILSYVLLVASANEKKWLWASLVRLLVNTEDRRDDGYDQQGGYAHGYGGYENQPANNNTQATNDTAALERIISKRYDKRDGYDNGYGYNNGGYSGGSYGGGYNNGGHTDGNHHGGGHNNETALQVLSNRNGTEFCSQYLAQTTQTVTETTLATKTNDLGTVTATSTEQTKMTVKTAVATITNTFTTTSTEIDSTTVTTATTYLRGLQQKRGRSPDQGLDRRLAHVAAEQHKHMQTRKRDMLPHWLQHFNETEVSSACSELVMPQTTFQTATVTQTDTTTTTSQIGPTTTTATLTFTSTTLSLVTETDSTTTLTATTTATTAYAIATECAQPSYFASVTSDSDSFFNTGVQQDAYSCCTVCLSDSAGCGFYYLDSNQNCFIAVARGTVESPNLQCPSGFSQYTVDTSSDENVGGLGPCGGVACLTWATTPTFQKRHFSAWAWSFSDDISPSLFHVNGAREPVHN